jgi:hypothetical protein
MKALIVASAAALFACMGAALAQAPQPSAAAPAQAGQAAATAPLKLDLPAADLQAPSQAEEADAPGVYYGDDGSDDSVQVHGSFTTGIGYSKGYGTSTMNAAEVHVSKQYDDGKTFDMQINLQQSKGPGFYPYGYYGAPYR